MNDEIKQKQEQLLVLLKSFDKFAKSNNIVYYAASGTCLGAVREHGFIPWDGDIDIILPLSEYQKCEKLLINGTSENIQMISYKTNSEAPNLMGRIYEEQISIENIEKYAYIDLFALVGVPEDKEQQARFMKKSLLNYRIYWIKQRKYMHSLNRNKSRIGLLLKTMLVFFPKRMCIREFERELRMFSYDFSEYVAPLTGLYAEREVVPREWFTDDPVYVPFCDYMIPITKKWDEYLTHMYGENYMTPMQYNRYK